MIVCFLSISDSTVLLSRLSILALLEVSVPPDLCLPCRKHMREKIPHALIQEEWKINFWKTSDKAKDLKAVELSYV